MVATSVRERSFLKRPSQSQLHDLDSNRNRVHGVCYVGRSSRPDGCSSRRLAKGADMPSMLLVLADVVGAYDCRMLLALHPIARYPHRIRK